MCYIYKGICIKNGDVIINGNSRCNILWVSIRNSYWGVILIVKFG